MILELMLKLTITLMILLLLANVYLNVTQHWIATIAESIAFHFLGGFLAAMLVFSLYHSEFAKLSQPVRFLTIVAITLMIGVFWEFSEYIANQTLNNWIYRVYHYRGYFMGDLDDTVQDLAMDTIGALTFVILGFKFTNPKIKS